MLYKFQLTNVYKPFSSRKQHYDKKNYIELAIR